MSKIGWRAWLTGPSGSLTSFFDWCQWPPDEPLIASCEGMGDHLEVSPARDCSCGIYIFKWAEDVEALVHTNGYRSATVIGAVEWWGKYEEHEIGYRVQYAQPRALYVLRGRIHPVYSHLIDINQSWERLVERWEEDEITIPEEGSRTSPEDQVDGQMDG